MKLSLPTYRQAGWISSLSLCAGVLGALTIRLSSALLANRYPNTLIAMNDPNMALFSDFLLCLVGSWLALFALVSCHNALKASPWHFISRWAHLELGLAALIVVCQSGLGLNDYLVARFADSGIAGYPIEITSLVKDVLGNLGVRLFVSFGAIWLACTLMNHFWCSSSKTPARV